MSLHFVRTGVEKEFFASEVRLTFSTWSRLQKGLGDGILAMDIMWTWVAF